MKKLWIIALLVVLSMVVPAAAQDTVPRFESSSCNFTVPTDESPECGYLIVPENRSTPNGKTIKVAMAIFRSDSPDRAADPVVYLVGGPGGTSLETASLEYGSFFTPFAREHDVILFDQRGVGLSEPSLNCDEATQFTYDTLGTELTADEYVQQYDAALTACAARLSGQGVDLSAYNSAESASDVNDMRAALGYDKLNLYGISYGTRLALTIMRDHPDAVRSTIIDSVVPLQSSYYDAGKSAQRDLDTLFKGCAADSACNAAYPNLEKVFYDLVNKLNAQPITIKVPNLKTGGQVDAIVDGDGLIGALFQAFYVTDLIPTLPKDIFDIQNGDYSSLVTITTLQLLQLNYVSSGMYMAVQCKEELPFNSAASITAILQATRPELQGFIRRQLIDPSSLDVCATWNEGAPNPIENQPVVSDIPTLVMSGEYDPITPPEYGKLAASTLSKSYFFGIPGTGHGVIPSNDCALSIAQKFIADPETKPDSSCLAGVKEPTFVVPGAAASSDASVTLVPFTNTTFGISGVVPDGWKEGQPGTYLRGSNSIDQTALSFQVIPGASAATTLPVLAQQFGISDTNGSIRVSNGLEWKLVQGDFGGVKLDLAMTDGVGGLYLIIFSTNNAVDEANFYNTIFLPVVDALIPG